MKDYQSSLVDLLFDYKAFEIGSFRLKSGSISPYFINFGKIDDGNGLLRLGEAFADLIADQCDPDSFDVILGPAYKGIAIATATVLQLCRKYGTSKGVVYNRKEKKEHGADAGHPYVGTLKDDSRILLIDDVFTSGGTKREVFESLPAGKIIGLAVGVDRQQHSKAGGEDMDAFCVKYGVGSFKALTIEELLSIRLKQEKLTQKQYDDVLNYVRCGEVAK